MLISIYNSKRYRFCYVSCETIDILFKNHHTKLVLKSGICSRKNNVKNIGFSRTQRDDL